MPKNKVSDPITDQEIAFARQVLSGAMTDRQAAEAVGLNPDSAAYTKAKPRVRAYMLEYRAAVQQQLVQQEAEGLHRLNLDREQVLARLWEIANLSPEMTRGSITGQVKGPLHDRGHAKLHPRPSSRLFGEKILACAHPTNLPRLGLTGRDRPPSPTPSSDSEEATPNPGPSQSAFVKPFNSSEAPPVAPYVPLYASVPDLRLGFSIKNPFVHPR